VSTLWFGEQYSPEWWERRRGKPSASQFGRIITPATGKLSTQHEAYLCELICERLMGHVFVGTGGLGVPRAVSPPMMHGRLVEDEAIARFIATTKKGGSKVGLVTTDDGKLVSSPDFVMLDHHAALEVKCPMPPTMAEYILFGHGKEYRPQVQGHLLVGEMRFAEIHFYAYHPGTPAYHTVTTPDGVYMEAMYEALDLFCDTLDEKTEVARGKGVWDWLGEVCRKPPEGFHHGLVEANRFS
jgi:hypothetical protein